MLHRRLNFIGEIFIEYCTYPDGLAIGLINITMRSGSIIRININQLFTLANRPPDRYNSHILNPNRTIDRAV